MAADKVNWRPSSEPPALGVAVQVWDSDFGVSLPGLLTDLGWLVLDARSGGYSCAGWVRWWTPPPAPPGTEKAVA